MEDKFTSQEEQLRALSEDFTLDIDTSELWDKVEAHLPPVQDDRRRPLIWWFASGACILVLSLLTWNYTSTDKENHIAPKTEPITKIAKVENSTTSLNKKHTKNNSLSSSLEIKESSNKNLTTLPDQHIANSNNQQTLKLTNQPMTESPNQQINHEKITFPAIFNSNRYDEKSKSWKEEEIDQSPIAQSIETLIDPSANPMKNDSNSDIIEERNVLSIVLLESISLSALIQDSKYDFTPRHIKPVNLAFWKPYYSLTSGINFHRNDIYSNSTDALDLNQFSNEKPLLGISSNLRFGFENIKGWRFGFGLSHNRIVDRYTLQETIVTTEEINGNATEKIDNEGNATFTDGSLSLTTITNHNLKWHRNHDFIGAQLSIGKQILGAGNFAFFTDVSLSKNIWSRHSGYYYTQGDEVITQFTQEENHPYSIGGYNAGLSMDFEYRINELSLCLRPFASLGLSSMTLNSNYYQIKNSQYGIQLGVVYRP